MKLSTKTKIIKLAVKVFIVIICITAIVGVSNIASTIFTNELAMTQMEADNMTWAMYQSYLNVIIPIAQTVFGFVIAVTSFFIGKDIYNIIKGEITK